MITDFIFGELSLYTHGCCKDTGFNSTQNRVTILTQVGMLVITKDLFFCRDKKKKIRYYFCCSIFLLIHSMFLMTFNYTFINPYNMYY